MHASPKTPRSTKTGVPVQITRYLRPEVVQLGMASGHVDGIDPDKDRDREKVRLKEAVIGELADLFAKSGQVRNRSKFHHDLLSRERKATTAIGMGLAIPHVRSLQPRQLCLVFARSRDGVEFLAPDSKPVHVIFGMAAPSYDERTTTEFLRYYQWIGRCFKEEDWLLRALLEAGDEHEIIAILSGLD